MRESCCLNIEIGVEYLMFLLRFLIVAMKCILRHLQDLEKVPWSYYKLSTAIGLSFSIMAANKKVNTFLNVWHQFQH